MFNKLVLINHGEPFEVKFVGTDHTVPNGKFEVEETLGNFILGMARKWERSVERLTDPEAPKVTKITEEDFISPVTEEIESEPERKLKKKK